jgi:16S rRNA (guanine1516-N2)-methyltransferase
MRHMDSAVVTTGHKYNKDNSQLARKIAARLNLLFVDRGNTSISLMMEQQGVQNVLVAKNKVLTLITPDGELIFHSGMAHLRIKNLRLGKTDNMLEAMGIVPGMSVLDCTLGFGADAIVAAYAVGATGSVIGLESSSLVAAVIGYGMQNFVAENHPIQEAMHRVFVYNVDYLNYLKKQPDKSFDVIYFDPMFRHPIKTSTNMDPLRVVANSSAVSSEAIGEALRVARKRVILKENSRSLEFTRLGFSHVTGGKYSPVHYGVMEV